METIKIGLVDDHNLFREGIKSLLEGVSNLELLFEAVSGNDLFVKLKFNKPDVILLDLEMEEMNGIESTQKLNAEFPDIKIIILSMHKEERMISYLMEIGAHSYLLKDANQQELTEAIEKVYTNGFYFNPKVSAAMLNRLKKKDVTVPVLGNESDLTPRELEVLKLIAQELTTPEIAEKLFLSTRTIEGYRKNLLSKMGAKNSAGLILRAIKDGLLTI